MDESCRLEFSPASSSPSTTAGGRGGSEGEWGAEVEVEAALASRRVEVPSAWHGLQAWTSSLISVYLLLLF